MTVGLKKMTDKVPQILFRNAHVGVQKSRKSIFRVCLNCFSSSLEMHRNRDNIRLRYIKVSAPYTLPVFQTPETQVDIYFRNLKDIR